jgi:hypothetical protein
LNYLTTFFSIKIYSWKINASCTKYKTNIKCPYSTMGSRLSRTGKIRIPQINFNCLFFCGNLRRFDQIAIEWKTYHGNRYVYRWDDNNYSKKQLYYINRSSSEILCWIGFYYLCDNGVNSILVLVLLPSSIIQAYLLTEILVLTCEYH